MNSIIKKIGFLVGISTLIVLLQSVSCNREPVHVKWANSELNAKKIVYDTLQNFSLAHLDFADTLEVEKDLLGFTLLLNVEHIASISMPRIIKPAYAFSYNTHYVLENRVDSVRIFTLRDYDASHLANANVNDLLSVFYDHKFVNFNTVIQESPYLNYTELDARNEGSMFVFEIKLNSPATLDSIVRFESRVYFSNRKTSIDTSEFIRLIK